MNKLKAFGLAEIIVALGIFGTAMIASVALAVSSLRTVKDNELADVANTIMIRSLEYIKSPGSVPVLSNLRPGSDFHSFRIINDIESTSIDQQMELEETTQAGTDAITDCSESSPYRVFITDLPEFLVCNQIIVEETDNNALELRSVIIYRTSRGLQRSELLGFRNTVGGI